MLNSCEIKSDTKNYLMFSSCNLFYQTICLMSIEILYRQIRELIAAKQFEALKVLQLF